MRLLYLLAPFYLSTILAAQQSLQEIRAEENLFIIKLIAVVVIILILMPLALRKIRAMSVAPKKEKRVFKDITEEDDDDDELVALKEEVPVEKDPLDIALEALLLEHPISLQQHDECLLAYRHYLEITMGRVEVATGSFDFNDLLNNVMHKIHKLDKNRNFEIVFDIASDVPSKVIGDAERISDALYYIIKNIVLRSDTYLLTLKIKRLNVKDDDLHLEFYIPYNISEKDAKKDLFTPFLDESSHRNVELYIAKKYAQLMHGDIALMPNGAYGSGFVMDLKLYMIDSSEMRHYRLPSKTMIGHKVLIVDDHVASGEAVQKMFEYFKNEVDLFNSKELFSNLQLLSDYDIVVIQERYFAKHLLSKLKEIKAKKEVKIVSLNKNEEFEHVDEETKNLLDAEISKPVTVQKVFDLLVSIFKEEAS